MKCILLFEFTFALGNILHLHNFFNLSVRNNAKPHKPALLPRHYLWKFIANLIECDGEANFAST